jgi:hypothetical protein
MIKVQVLTTCDFCEGDAYLPDGEAESYSGEKYTRYKPCPYCDGSGKILIKYYFITLTRMKFISIISPVSKAEN